MYIAPNSTIKLLTGVPIDKNQSDTLWFASVGDQTAYFNSKVKRTFTAQTYNRVQRGYTRLEVSADAIYDCNYMMFQNTSYGSKWFYAFIDNVEYINNEVAEVRFEIDPIQTWFFDYTLNQCFIERATPTTDAIGDNILPEPVQVGEYVYNNDYSIIGADITTLGFVCALIDPAHNADFFGGGIYNNVVSGAKLYAYYATTEGVGLFNTQILGSQAVRQAPDALIMIYMCPASMLLADNKMRSATLSDHLIPPNNTLYEQWATASQINTNTYLNGYKPRNAKCYTYPYTFFNVDNGQGEGLVARYEFFYNNQPQFHITGNVAYPVELTLFPYNYKNIRSGNNVNNLEYRGEKIAIKGFPQGSWSMDAYSAWVAQNSVPMIIDTVATAIPMVVGGVGAIVGAVASGGMSLGATALAGAKGALGNSGGMLNNITNIMKEQWSASISADITKGSVATGSNDVASKRMCFKGGCVTQPAEIMRSIDNFFDVFGYSKREWAYVNIHARTRWTYVKTIGANVEGSVPADDAEYIANCYDRGIRFWADTTNPCDYTADNGFLS